MKKPISAVLSMILMLSMGSTCVYAQEMPAAASVAASSAAVEETGLSEETEAVVMLGGSVSDVVETQAPEYSESEDAAEVSETEMTEAAETETAGETAETESEEETETAESEKADEMPELLMGVEDALPAEEAQVEKKLNGLVTVEDKTFYYKDGAVMYGEHKVDGAWRYFDPLTGEMVTGFATIPGGKTGQKIVYYDPTGAMVYGEYKAEDAWRYFSIASGEMTTGFATIPGGKSGQKVVFYNPTGAMVYGEYKADGKWRYFSTSSGEMVTGFATIPGGSGKKLVFYRNDGSMAYGNLKVSGTKYFFDKGSGQLQHVYNADGTYKTGEQKVAGAWRYFSPADGSLTTGFVQLPHKKVYYDTDGAMVYGEYKADGKWRYFNTASGAMTTGFVLLPHKIVYYGRDGGMVYGTHTINGQTLQFNTASGALKGSETIDTTKMTAKERRVVETAVSNRGANGALLATIRGMCAAWVWHVFDEAGVPYEAKELAVQVYEAGLKASGKGIKNLAPGVVLFGSGSGAYNAGHVGIYVGGNLVIDNMGYQRITTLKEWTSNLQHYGTITTPKATYKGYVGWFWPEGVNLSK